MPLEPPFPKEFTKENFEVLQKDVHEIIDSVAKDKKGKFKPKKLSSLRYSILPLFGEGAVLNATGTAHDTFILKLFFLLFTQPLAKVRSCPLCGTIFYRSGKQKYCSLINVK